jgi:hypothetical protein
MTGHLSPLHLTSAEPQVSADDAIEGMAYYIALYLARAPEARHMEPKQLQEALRTTFTVGSSSSNSPCRPRCTYVVSMLSSSVDSFSG